jgi:nucleoside permease NupC
MMDLLIGVGGIVVVFTIAYITSVRRKRRQSEQD